MNRKFKYILIIGGIIILFFLPLFLDGSYYQSDDNWYDYGVTIYFVDIFSQSLVVEQRAVPSYFSTEEAVNLILEEMDYPTLLGSTNALRDAKVVNFSLNEDNLLLYLSEEYNSLTMYEEILARAALVHTFSGLGNIENIYIYVEGQPILNSYGMVMGGLNRQNVRLLPKLDPAETTITQTIGLYFVLEDLSGLSLQWVDLSIASGIPIEKQVLEEMFNRAATGRDNLFIPPETIILDVNTIESIVYIDLSHHFDTAPIQGELAQLLTIQGIVNTLTSLNGVNIQEIEFLIEGQRLTEYNGYVDLSQAFGIDYDIHVVTTYNFQ